MDKKIEEELEKLSRKVFDDDEFVMGMKAFLKTDNIRSEFIKYMKKHPSVSSEELCLMSLEAYQEMKENNII